MCLYPVLNSDLFRAWPLTLHVSANTHLLFSQASLSAKYLTWVLKGIHFLDGFLIAACKSGTVIPLDVTDKEWDAASEVNPIKCLICENEKESKWASFASGRDECVRLMRAVVMMASGTGLMKLEGLLECSSAAFVDQYRQGGAGGSITGSHAVILHASTCCSIDDGKH